MFLVTPLHTLWAGEEAVILFFILSGFVLSMPFLNSKEFILNNYLIKRFCRIYLPYIFVMFISTCLMIFMSPYNGMPNMTDWFNWRWSHKPTLESIASYIFMLGYDYSNVNGPAWSLVHELRISIIFPLIMLFVVKPNTKKAIIISLSIITFACTLLYGISSLIPEKISIVFLINSFGDTLFYSVFFIIGALFAKYRENFKSLVYKASIKKKTILIMIALVLLNLNDMLPFLRGLPKITDLSIIPSVIIMFLFAFYDRKTKAFLSKPAFVWLGKISYSLYLTHMVVMTVVIYTLGSLIPIYISLATVPFISLLVAAIINRFVELPSQSLGKRLTEKKRSRLTEVVLESNA